MTLSDFPVSSSTVDEADRAFIVQVIHKIPGWLSDYTAFRIMELMRWQTSAGIRGAAFEIGVYAGRCFAVLLREAARAGDLAVGLDTFHRVDEAAVRGHLGIDGSIGNVRFVHGRSVEFGAERLFSVLGGTARFISIDGSHMLEDVRHDLAVCEDVLSDFGIIACDDFLNPVRMGVAQAVHERLSSTTGLAPFAYVQNKLFLCRRSVHSELLNAAMQFCENDKQGPGAVFAENNRDRNGRNETQLYGWPLVVIP
jgi:Methyltransferase domain